VHTINETPIPTQELKAAEYFHGHRCPAMPQGLRAGHVAMDWLGVSRARGGGELVAIIETGSHHFSGCFADGVMFATGCTIGKSNLILNPLGKFALTLYVPKSHQAVRVTLRYERMSQCLDMDFFKLRAQGIPPFDLDPQVVDPLIQEVLTKPWMEIFALQEFEEYPFDMVPEVFEAVQCSICHELVVKSYAHQFRHQWYCKPCLDQLLHAPLASKG
jgi:formylmethanofuran dehydrogenase subunit E